MPHENKDELLRLFYQEVSPLEEQNLRQHLAACENCREYMRFLNQMYSTLSHWQDEQPLAGTFDRILANIPAAQPKAIYVRPAVSARPIFAIAFALAFMVLLIYFVQSRVSLLPFWASWSQHWLVQALGNFGFVALAFFALGTFITLSLAPILYFDLNKRTLHI